MYSFKNLMLKLNIKKGKKFDIVNRIFAIHFDQNQYLA